MQTNNLNALAHAPRKVCTESELQALPEDGCVHELVDGELVVSSKDHSVYSHVGTRLTAALLAFAETRRLGVVWDSNTGVRMYNANVRAPDVSFVRRARLKERECRRVTRRLFPGAPDLAIEILSPNCPLEEMDVRLRDYFSSGSRLAWIVDTEAQQLEACRSLSERRWVGSAGFLDGEDLLPGFRYPLADLFKDWDWE
ncbi:MAG TPA: Uma2 family endonuclease [Candidatus Cybelea sp.]|nr:Uma2 family endonuclease [Candidatus Cybelea sp.]